ncbi:hypothetical protein COE91_22795 [Bacillus toyonensis]|nr:hypothetical protein COE91_22795 [Bacillus toyonensis]
MPCKENYKEVGQGRDVLSIDVPEIKIDMCLKELELKKEFNLGPIGKKEINFGTIKFDLPCIKSRNTNHKVVMHICYPQDMTAQIRKQIYECTAKSASEVANHPEASFGKIFSDCFIENALPYIMNSIDVNFEHTKEHGEWEDRLPSVSF